MKSGIYQILNLKNNKSYIGSATNINSRWCTHKATLRNNIHHSIILQNAWNKYGEENFNFILLEKCEVEDLIEREQYYLNTLKPKYNVRQIADSNRGVKRSEEYKLQSSLSRIGKKRSPESIAKWKETMKGYQKTPEHLENLRKAYVSRKPITVTNTETGVEQDFISVKETAAHFKTTTQYIARTIRKEKLIRKIYQIKYKIDV